MTNNIEKKIDIPMWWNEKKINEYKDTLKWREIGETQTAEEKKQAAELLKQIEWTETQKNTRTVTHENIHNNQRTDGQTWNKENPGEANIKRVDAGKNIIDDVNKPQTNIVAKWLQRIVKKIWWF